MVSPENIGKEDVKISEYPQLRLLCWSFRPDLVLCGKDALSIYERNWVLVDQGALLDHEKALIARLVRDFGNGVLMV